LPVAASKFAVTILKACRPPAFCRVDLAADLMAAGPCSRGRTFSIHAAAHAARSRRWRQRRHDRACQQHAGHDAAADDATILDGGVINFVTHQGSPTPALDAPLTPGAELAAAVTGALTPPSAVWCRRCAAPLPPWVRQGFLRHGMRRWPPRVIEPSP